ncbi:NLR family CARD domain-containing protein 3 [Nothobranchius furzeri]|uniref:NLR family CARD domain-containing protein 3 n=1 Tax=Nothobranchius furzeri TaxID=105023 RepID=UPI0024045198|nr:NLR family CARD domain-containing protein 3 [Nothobranchius furzeri]
MSAELSRSPHKQRFKANILERCRLQKRLLSSAKHQPSDVELSAESDTIPQPDEKPEEEEEAASQNVGEEEPATERDLHAQLDAMMMVLKTSEEVEQLVLRNTGLTDDHLLSLAGVLKSSPSAVTLLNLNLNLIGPFGAHILLDVLRVKPQVKGLHLFGNKLRDHGVLTLMTGIAELQEQSALAAAAIQQALLFPTEQNVLLQLPTGWRSSQVFTLLELDIGGNGVSSEGVRVLASYIRAHSRLQYLGLAQTSGADLAAWKELFESLRGNRSLAQIILDENNLGDPGVRLLADVLKENVSLQQVDLDGNGISDVGGNDIMGALLCRMQFPLRHLSLQQNDISVGLMSRIQQEVKVK